MNAEYAHSQRQKPPFMVYMATSFVIFFLALSAADSVGFVPFYVDGTSPTKADIALSDLPELGEEVVVIEDKGVLPERIIISAIGLDLPVQNPDTRSIEVLDTLLQKGPARYVDSAKLGEKGNVLLFAHSSHLPIVHNQMYKAFNRVPELKAGDSIVVEGEGKSFLYTVTSVKSVDANDATVDLSISRGKKLTLVTCDTLTGKSARFVLEADFVAQL